MALCCNPPGDFSLFMSPFADREAALLGHKQYGIVSSLTEDWAKISADLELSRRFTANCAKWSAAGYSMGVSPPYSAWACEHPQRMGWHSPECNVYEPMKIPMRAPCDELAAQDCAQSEHASGYEQTQVHKPPGLGSECRWHKSANSVGTISPDGHTFTKTSGGQKTMKDRQGNTVELSSICMVFDETLRYAGRHRFEYTILDGELGAADGVGFVFDTHVRRNNIQRMRSVFLNRKGQLCVRDQQSVHKLGTQLPPLAAGMQVYLDVDLEILCLRFSICDAVGMLCGVKELNIEALFDPSSRHHLHSGFFCAVVTKEISVRLM